MKIYDYNEIKALPLSVAQAGCFVLNMPNDVYQKFAGISKSGLDFIAKSPAAYKDRPPYQPNRAMVVGSALHSAILEPALFETDYHLLPEVKDRRSAEYKKLKEIYGEEWVLVGKECTDIAAMTEMAHRDSDVMDLLNMNGQSEVSAFVTCPDTGLLLRCRYDYISFENHTVADLKKTRDASVFGFSKSVHDYRYHVQEAFYSYVYHLLTGEPLEKFTFIAIQETAPHTARVYDLDEIAEIIGMHYFQKDLAVYADCNNRNFWPHPDCNGEISLPYYAINDYEREIDENMMDEFTGDES